VPTPGEGSRPTQTPSSWRLLASAREGNADALARLFDRYLPELKRWTAGRLPWWLRSTADTSDVVQDAVVRTLARLDAFQPQGRRALAGYLRTAVEHRVADHHRRAARWRMSPIAADAIAREPSPLEQAIARENQERYRAALARLSRRDQELVVAHVELDYSHAQLGCMIGRSPNAARMALCRALERLAIHMRDA
jgi:RNA polymerase sigma factor (sigma-70 family)